MATYEIVESKHYLVTADSEDEAYRKFGNYEHDEESDFKTDIRKLPVTKSEESSIWWAGKEYSSAKEILQRPFYVY